VLCTTAGFQQGLGRVQKKNEDLASTSTLSYTAATLPGSSRLLFGVKLEFDLSKKIGV
jgi:hypothetical protein